MYQIYADASHSDFAGLASISVHITKDKLVLGNITYLKKCRTSGEAELIALNKAITVMKKWKQFLDVNEKMKIYTDHQGNITKLRKGKDIKGIEKEMMQSVKINFKEFCKAKNKSISCIERKKNKAHSECYKALRKILRREHYIIEYE